MTCKELCIDVYCPCGGLVYKYGISKSKCVRGEREFTLEQYEMMWKEAFEKK